MQCIALKLLLAQKNSIRVKVKMSGIAKENTQGQRHWKYNLKAKKGNDL